VKWKTPESLGLKPPTPVLARWLDASYDGQADDWAWRDLSSAEGLAVTETLGWLLGIGSQAGRNVLVLGTDLNPEDEFERTVGRYTIPLALILEIRLLRKGPQIEF